MLRVYLVVLLFTAAFYGCSSNNVTVDDSIGRYFDSAGVKGAFGLFDNGHGHFTIYNLPRYRDSFYTPGATFDIIQSLVAIETGVVQDDSSHLETDYPSDLPKLLLPVNFGEDFRDTGAFNELTFLTLYYDKHDSLKKWIDSLQYGNKKVDDSAEFWLNDGLKINCDQQLGLLKKLYFNQLPFFARTQGIVRRMMASESNSAYRFSYKTAQGKKEDGHRIGWVIGWVEENKHPNFFVLNLESADTTKDLRRTGLKLVKDILLQQGFFEGKK